MTSTVAAKVEKGLDGAKDVTTSLVIPAGAFMGGLFIGGKVNDGMYALVGRTVGLTIHKLTPRYPAAIIDMIDAGIFAMIGLVVFRKVKGCVGQGVAYFFFGVALRATLAGMSNKGSPIPGERLA